MKRSPEKNITKFKWIVAKSLSTIVKKSTKKIVIFVSRHVGVCVCGGGLLQILQFIAEKMANLFKQLSKKYFDF